MTSFATAPPANVVVRSGPADAPRGSGGRAHRRGGAAVRLGRADARGLRRDRQVVAGLAEDVDHAAGGRQVGVSDVSIAGMPR
jgi:hypothetical protein